ncbi:MAG: hypothetical protein GX352_06055 [Clostridiales bacterium]|nr:hypothetical protein [Clostridiales bacterium]
MPIVTDPLMGNTQIKYCSEGHPVSRSPVFVFKKIDYIPFQFQQRWKVPRSSFTCFQRTMANTKVGVRPIPKAASDTLFIHLLNQLLAVTKVDLRVL